MDKYIRVGEIPEDEKSTIYKGNGDEQYPAGKEKGVSVWDCIERFDRELNKHFFQPVLPMPTTEYTLNDFMQLHYKGNKRVYLVRGDYVGRGSCNEPLIQNVLKIKDITDDIDIIV